MWLFGSTFVRLFQRLHLKLRWDPRYSRQNKRWDEKRRNERTKAFAFGVSKRWDPWLQKNVLNAKTREEKTLAFFFSANRNSRGSSKKVRWHWTGFFLRLYRHRPPPTKPVGVEPICPPQTSTAGVRHGGRQRFSSIEVGQYGCWQRFLDSDEHWTTPICLYIYTKLEISTPLQVKSKISIPTHNTKPTTISAFYLQASLFLLPPRSDLQVVVSTSIAWWSITRLDFAGESIDG